MQDIERTEEAIDLLVRRGGSRGQILQTVGELVSELHERLFFRLQEEGLPEGMWLGRIGRARQGLRAAKDAYRASENCSPGVYRYLREADDVLRELEYALMRKERD